MKEYELMILGSKLNSAEKSAAGKAEIKLTIVGQWCHSCWHRK